ncbi:Glutaredoxin-3 [Candidatus Arcanobacter lacustris]|jgi:glutaredoxin 3|uniref:Glutaredoxin n=1 Tax=Candidatus Arcanibacter lacustris TaxID=1607817 RepID=A0A0F5MMM2_9RICK|nr:Glutaredoxin-3 [Candidatus Arcanobacter lacustris]
MAEIIIYTKSHCPYCVKAKQLFKMKKVSYQEIDITDNASLLEEMLAKSSGRKTVPQIFIGKQHIGGCDDLYALNEQGKLDPLLTVYL